MGPMFGDFAYYSVRIERLESVILPNLGTEVCPMIPTLLGCLGDSLGFSQAINQTVKICPALC